jgi:hypothetical protein
MPSQALAHAQNPLKQMQNSKQDCIANNQKRLHKLIGEWMNKCRDIMVDSLLGYFGNEAMASMEPERNVVYIKMDFDYNHHTFVPTQPPIIAAVDDLLLGQYAARIHRLYDEAEQHAPSNLLLDMQDVEFVPVISFIGYIGGHANDSDRSNDRQYMIHTNMVDLDEDDDDDDCEHEVSCKEMVNELKYNVALITSKKFPKWESLRKENIEKQIHATQRDENFAPFDSHALQMLSNEPKNALHVVVMIHVKQGFGLGEISSVANYSLVARKEVKKEVKKRVLNMVDLDPNRHRAIVVFNSGGGTATDIYQVVLVENSPPTTLPTLGP